MNVQETLNSFMENSCERSVRNVHMTFDDLMEF